jgi:hypothetical protein
MRAAKTRKRHSRRATDVGRYAGVTRDTAHTIRGGPIMKLDCTAREQRRKPQSEQDVRGLGPDPNRSLQLAIPEDCRCGTRPTVAVVTLLEVSFGFQQWHVMVLNYQPTSRRLR